MSSAELPRAIALMGPTASGKTRLAIRLAQELDGEVISVDSGLVYRGMDIGTAKPTMAERQGIPHHLIDILDPSEAFSTGQFRERALKLAEAITARGRVPLLVGGTMLYFNALFHGLAPLPSADPEVRLQIDEEAAHKGWARLHEELGKVDPDAAARIHPNDPQRIQRALEVYRITGIPLSELCAQAESVRPAFDFIRIIVAPADREALRERIRLRFLGMLELGLVEEVRKLFERGDLNEHMPSMRAVGYRQVWAYLGGEYDHGTMVERAIIATRQFAKRQYTWLRRERSALSYLSEDADLLQKVIRDVKPLCGR
jgi:tRNA dimethylallyltransferase